MSYKDKVFKKKLFRQSLTDLVNFSFSEPQLPLKNRQAIVAAITLGSSLSNRYKHFNFVSYYHLNYQYTRLGLIRACSDKMISYPADNQKVQKAIYTLSALSAWSKTNPNWSKDIFEDFVQQIIPENKTEPPYPLSTKVIGNLKKEMGHDFALDLVTLSGSLFYKKYQGK